MATETPRTLREAAETLSRRLERLYHDRIDLEFPWEQEWKALHAALASTEEAPLREALEAIRDAEREATVCTGPCMYPQLHSDDETGMDFARRLQKVARAALDARGDTP